ncbi:MAG: DUF5320 domain-containing protein [Dehalococcoidia bacterium]|nr:DUF5320 domain-containing protein [Dehalococcoidia bacterium]
MYYRFGRGRGFGMGGGGYGRGLGFGFRGVSPPWPYVGVGRGGLPRCAYFFGGIPAYWRTAYVPPLHGWSGPGLGYAPYASPSTEEEITDLRNQAEAIRSELSAIESRMRDLQNKSGQ